METHFLSEYLKERALNPNNDLIIKIGSGRDEC